MFGNLVLRLRLRVAVKLNIRPYIRGYTSQNDSYHLNELRHEISNNVVCATSKASAQSAYTCSLIRAFASRLNILWVLNYWLNIVWSLLAKKGAAQACPSLHLSKCHIVGNHMSRLKSTTEPTVAEAVVGLKCILLVPNLHPRFCCCFNTKKIVKLTWRLPNQCNA